MCVICTLRRHKQLVSYNIPRTLLRYIQRPECIDIIVTDTIKTINILSKIYVVFRYITSCPLLYI